jgi:NAD(P)-dependent dehydrogenase (short-subunit alcohol dehydrogenase family)
MWVADMLGGEKKPPMNELISLRNKRALISGSGAGIGAATAYRFAEAGANLHLVGLHNDKLKKVKDNLKQFNVDIETYQVNVSKKEEIDTLWKQLDGKEPDILVNNAGVFPVKNFLKLDQPFLTKILDTNLNSVLWMCQHMIDSRKKKGGVIINTSSTDAFVPIKDGMCHYGVSKAGIMALSRGLAAEYGKHGFRINILMPGGIWTPGTKAFAKDAMIKAGTIKSSVEYYIRNPSGRMGRADEVARMALVLASDLSSYMNGTIVVVDGGQLST